MEMEGYIKKLFLTGNLKYVILTEVRSNGGATPYRTLSNIRKKGIKLDAGSYYNSVKSLLERKLLEKKEGKRTRSSNLFITEEGKVFLREYKRLFSLVQARVKEKEEKKQ